MQKVVFYPLSFRLRSWSLPARLITGTLVVFAVTWFFHAYQWFWLRGSFLLAGTDVAFWVLFGALVAVNTFWEARHGR
ncbi:MAG: hypothetical protein GWN58_48155, partial [Anaerolineae bacterium]|nr:hypothetical protein [Anaerolineae bacterium]